jgi:hypothetical protein
MMGFILPCLIVHMGPVMWLKSCAKILVSPGAPDAKFKAFIIKLHHEKLGDMMIFFLRLCDL